MAIDSDVVPLVPAMLSLPSLNGHSKASQVENAKSYIAALLAGQKPESRPDVGKWSTAISDLEYAYDNAQGDQVIMARAYASILQSNRRPELAELDKPASEQKQRSIRFLDDTELETRPEREWLIPGILPKAGIAMVFGPPASGKSLLVMAWSLCISRGLPWLDRPVTVGPVAYIASEGSFGLKARMTAWKLNQGIPGMSGVRWFDQTLTLQDNKNVAELLVALEEDFPEPPALVVIDTLSRCSGGADENSNTEMAKVISSADAIQQKFGCTVLFIHHVGKDAQKGPRGASVLIGNMETIIEVSPTDEGCRVSCYKQKDAPRFLPIHLQIQSVEWGQGNEENSAILIPGTDTSHIAMTHSETVMFAALAGKRLTYGDWVRAGVEMKLADRTAKDAIAKLKKMERVTQFGKLYCIALETSESESETGQGVSGEDE